ncbi:hypothetical protein PARPLA_02945 [Rhodobacteraceae bacterium THAF1]|uniref:hypothetical protein n=1 Tax=Palleronia sp. THAF1 TaxID=2587842 RepID=UPI000F3F851C|nr:hypothetical protein [Palleronia sp. THAF1]QFU08346.1 hypothetical protein FIU81_06635 [Palleronia sp. THAF1]VDC29013.1 hypothetical protein PARPLA_02945 [Rhodobacteraceae bacterium THAF1]
MDIGLLQTVARALIAFTPLVVLLFLTSFLVWLGQGTRSNRFTRFCDAAMVPSGLTALALVLATLIFF